VIRPELGIDEEEFAAQYDDYRHKLRRFHTVPGSPATPVAVG
jgi:hypothetical protein